MASYTITITPDDKRATSTRLRLETSGDQVILTELHLHASGGLSTGQLPAIDYGLLLRAISPTTPTPISLSPAPTTGDRAEPATRTGPRKATTGAAPAKPVKSTRGRRPATAVTKVVAAPAKITRRGKQTNATEPTRKTSAAATKPTTSSSGRAYRRMPDDLPAVYQQAGTAAAIADHYDVPAHTAHGWIRRLREQGTLPTGR